MKIVDQNNNELNDKELDYNKGYLIELGNETYQYFLFTQTELKQIRYAELKNKIKTANRSIINYEKHRITKEQYDAVIERKTKWEQELAQLKSELGIEESEE